MPAIASELATLLHQCGFIVKADGIYDHRGRLLMSDLSLQLWLDLSTDAPTLIGKLARRLRLIDRHYEYPPDPTDEIPPAQNDFE